MVEILALGQRVRHARQQAGLTLEELSTQVGVTASQLSLVETGKREAKIGLLSSLATALGVEVSELLDETPPNERARLEREWANAAASPLISSLGLPPLRVSKSVSDEHLQVMVGLYHELVRREKLALATPEEARRANTELRHQMRELNNYRDDLEELAEDLVRSVGHTSSGALTHREVAMMAGKLGCRPPRFRAAMACARWHCKPWHTSCSNTLSRRPTRSFCSSASKLTTSPRRV
jgi:transcriptional regulator with XRE-family HTH domain